MKKILASILVLAMMAVSFIGCTGTKTSSPEPAAPADSSAEVPVDSSVEAPVEEKELYIAVISKGFQHQFWQVVKNGADQAAKDLGVTITFDGPPSESDINIQVDMLKSAMAKNPDAIALAALSTDSVKEDINDAMKKGIPIVGFDSGVPDAPAGSIYATASTDNKAAAALAGEMLMKNAEFTAKLEAATPEAPIVIGVLSQDATSESIVSRTEGFIDKVVELIGADNVQVIGHDKYAKPAEGAKVTIQVVVPATTANSDLKASAESLLTAENIVVVYGSNEAAAGGLLSASNDGSDFADGAKYADIVAIGFDAGKIQRVAVENGWFYGSVTQDPFSIGYKAVELAVKAVREGGEFTNEMVDTGAKWYNSENLSDPDITDLVYE